MRSNMLETDIGDEGERETSQKSWHAVNTVIRYDVVQLFLSYRVNFAINLGYYERKCLFKIGARGLICVKRSFVCLNCLFSLKSSSVVLNLLYSADA